MKNLRTALNTYKTITIFVVLLALFTVIFGTVMIAVQQSYRTNANDPQVEVTGQVAEVMNQNVPLDAIVSDADQIEMDKSLSLFVMIFDKDKKLAGSSAVIDGQPPTPPDGTFEVAKKEGENRFTWEPKKGVRVAAVLKSVGDKGYVLAGRSLKEIEMREQDLYVLILIGWIISILLALILSLLIRPHQSLTIVEETNVTVVDESGGGNSNSL